MGSTADDGTKQIQCEKRGFTYSPTDLSDGERQVLGILTDIVIHSQPNSVIFVDEPELNLHPELAKSVWDTVENELDDAVFVYATHSLAFAMRAAVKTIVVLGGYEKNPMQIEGIAEIEPSELREFLGAIPAILAASRVVATEGDESSFDNTFYRWILGSFDAQIIPLGSRNAVISATKGSGVWERLAPSVRVIGVVDRDYWPDASISALETEVCTVLDFHEAESYLCHPEAVVDLADKLGLVPTIPTEVEILEGICQFIDERRCNIAALRTFAATDVSANVSLPKSTLRELTSEQEYRKAIADSFKTKAQSVITAVDEAKGIERFNQELARCKQATVDRDISELLTLAPGKELLPMLMQRTGCKSPQEMARAALKHLNPQKYQHTDALQVRLAKLLDYCAAK